MAGPAAIWKPALQVFLDEGHKAGDVLTHQWFLDHFQIEVPDNLTRDEWNKWNLKFLSCFMPFREHLLKDYLVDLQPIGGESFVIVPPGEQTRSAMLELGGNYKRIHKRCGLRLRYVNKGELSQQQLQENADALSKLSQLKALSGPIWSAK